jgi:hypothetical protein
MMMLFVEGIVVDPLGDVIILGQIRQVILDGRKLDIESVVSSLISAVHFVDKVVQIVMM